MKYKTTNVLDLIGDTPLCELSFVPTGSIFAKLEMMNPGGSVKDRIAVGMIEDARNSGALKKGGTIVEPTAGNTGIALALVGSRLGYKTIFTVPQQFSSEKITLMKALGSEIVRTPESEGMKGAIDKAFEISDGIPNSFVPQQFSNSANPEYHYKTTAVEIYKALGDRIDAVAIGAGTGGTFTGVAKFLKEKDSDIKTFVVQPQGSVFDGSSPGSHRVEGIGNTFVPECLDLSLADDVITVQDSDSFDMVSKIAEKESLFVGGSSGTNCYASLQITRRLSGDPVVVTVFPDSSERYLSKNPYNL